MEVTRSIARARKNATTPIIAHKKPNEYEDAHYGGPVATHTATAWVVIDIQEVEEE